METAVATAAVRAAEAKAMDSAAWAKGGEATQTAKEAVTAGDGGGGRRGGGNEERRE